MKVVLDARLLMPAMTGIGRYLIGLLDGFNSKELAFDMDVWLQRNISDDHPVWKYQNGRINLQRIPLKHMEISQYWEIPILVRRASPTIYHYPHFDMPLFVSCSKISTIHDVKYLVHPEFFPKYNRVKKVLIKGLMGRTIKNSRYVISVSKTTKRDLQNIFHVPDEKILVIYEGVDRIFYKRLGEEKIQAILAKHNINRPYILFVGEKRPHKNIDVLIKAFAELSKMVNNEFMLVIVGKKYADYQIPEQITEELGLHDLVVFINGMNDEELRACYQAAEIFMTLSKYEGFGLPVLEAMASGTPVVAAANASLPEIVGDAGVLVDTENSEMIARTLRNILRNKEKREYLVDLGLRRAREFNWQRCAEETISIYAKVAKEEK